MFCRIIAGEVPAKRLAENQSAVAIADVAPVAPSHALVLPKEHIRDAAALDPSHASLLSEMIGLAQQVAINEGIADTGYRLVFNVGGEGGNTVAHLHLHVIGGRQMTWPPG